MNLEKRSCCKVNLLLNILGQNPDGYHELETVLQPVALYDKLTFQSAAAGVELSCDHPELPCDSSNLVHRAAASFLQKAAVTGGVRIHLEKRIPMAAGLGGGSGNAAATLVGLNELFGNPLDREQVAALAAALGSDVPFFLQSRPALATGRGEKIALLERVPALEGCCFLLVNPGFGISTAWAYQQLSRFPSLLHGRPGRAAGLVAALERSDPRAAADLVFNSLEGPALRKYPILGLYQDFLRGSGAVTALMSGSGSTTFGLFEKQSAAQEVVEKMKARFGRIWTAVVPV